MATLHDFEIVPFDGHTGKDGARVTLYRIGETTIGLFLGRDAGRKERRLREAGISPFETWVGTLRADEQANLRLEGEWIAGKLGGSVEAIAQGPEAEKLLRVTSGVGE